MKTNSTLHLSALALTAAFLLVIPLRRPSRAQEATAPLLPKNTAGVRAPGSALLRPVGSPDERQVDALQRARLERGLVLAERTAQMLDAFEAALIDMDSPGADTRQDSQNEVPR